MDVEQACALDLVRHPTRICRKVLTLTADSPCIGAVLIGAGFLMIFQASLNYIIDTFQLYAASAVASITALRSIFAGVFPLFATPSMLPPSSCSAAKSKFCTNRS